MTGEPLSKRERTKLPRQTMPERPADERRHDFDEVNLGFPGELAMLEATRCLECRNAPCVAGCPVGVRINEFVPLLAMGEWAAAAAGVAGDNSLPAVCGRVCPQEEQCEGACVLGKKGRPIAIGHLERFVADWRRDHPDPTVAERSRERTGKRIAIVGSGPAGLACAADCARFGHDVTVFEALHEFGGVLRYGIPEYRLPNDIVEFEIAQLSDLGVEFVSNAVIGMADTVDDLLAEEGFDAVFIGTGAGLPRFLGVPGENLIGVYSANEFLTRVNLMEAYREDAETPVLNVRGRVVAVFGAGNTAMDAVRTALRLGASKALLVYRRSEAEMPARDEEVAHARAEGVEFVTLTNPVSFFGTEDGWLQGVNLQQMELGEAGEDGRRRPEPVEGSEYDLALDVAIIAIGNGPNPIIGRTTPGLDSTARGTVAADETNGHTSRAGVFAGGDIVTGGATVILAMGAGRRAATAIDEYVRR